MAIDLPQIAQHPNRVAFRGVLTLVDVASDKPPAGARGHRVMLTRTGAERALPSLLGMGLDYAPSWDRHDTRRKVGVIAQADIVPLQAGRGYAIEVSGYLYGKDFPEVVHELRSAGRTVLGMSYEIADASVEEVSATVWNITQFTFTGAALLRRDKAAYQTTWAELSE